MTDTKKNNSFVELLKEGQALYEQEKYKDAIKIFRLILLMVKNLDNVNSASLYIRLANAYYKIDDKDKSTYYYEEYLKVCPEGQVSVFSRLAHAYYYTDSDRSIDYHNKALNIKINKYDVSCKFFAMTKSSYYDQQDIKDEAELEISRLKNTLFKNIVKYNHEDKKQNPNKKLRIGYLSSDCFAHTMMNYILPIWENHNREEFEIILFNGAEKKDSVSERIINLGYKIVDCAKLETEEIAKLIYEEQIDILVDLGGFTHLKCFSAFYKPAPIIVSYLGYLNTMGMREVDYILADRFSIPEENAYLYTEKPLYLDKGYQIYQEKKVPAISDCPFISNGYITFGSFNCTSKLNDATLYMWSQILKELPNSKLLIYRTQMTIRNIKHLNEKFVQRDISLDRIIYNSTPFDTHYKAYSMADISLDPYPFSGMSITIETARMGLPTITLLGEGLQSRGAGRINNMLNLSELNANIGEEYIKKAVELANDKDKLVELRKVLRDRIENSYLRLNPENFVRDLEDKYKKAWQSFIDSP